ncbi:Nulp1-pending protein [Arthroderma uncinatum]|uniref:Nulp1-pending protein n=1 Tax=Arthroderma uncinatum TaxID=74035 RepID=UPI00144AF089|nr:Nulp1-pending protein [Arthroderma uncinatum]KAF3491275.1 Nulp1-pending protein [Arthroderma uncinatum]
MSSRALRKLQKQKEVQQNLDELQDESDDSEPAVPISRPKINAFDLLGDQDEENGDESDVEASAAEESQRPASPVEVSKPTTSKRKKKKSKKRAKKGADLAETKTPDSEAPEADEIDLALEALALKHPLQSEDQKVKPGADLHDSIEQDLCTLLEIDPKKLVAMNEMKRLFGNAAVETRASPSESPSGNRRRDRNRRALDLGAALTGRYSPASRGQDLSGVALRKNVLMQGKVEWPKATSGGLGMEIVQKFPAGVVEYEIVHNTAYKDVQRQFDMCVESMQPERMIELLQYNPYHISTLLQVSEIAKHQGDHAVSADLLERALFNIGRSAQSSFGNSLKEGKARLDFTIKENPRAKDIWNTPEATALLVEVADSIPAPETPPKAPEISQNVARHVILSDISAVTSHLPRHFTIRQMSSSDPLPPNEAGFSNVRSASMLDEVLQLFGAHEQARGPTGDQHQGHIAEDDDTDSAEELDMAGVYLPESQVAEWLYGEGADELMEFFGVNGVDPGNWEDEVDMTPIQRWVTRVQRLGRRDWRQAITNVAAGQGSSAEMVEMVPQLIENYKNGNAQAISFAFILVWFIGDIANLIGSLWAGLVPVVVAIAIWFCIADGVLICQCIYYNEKASQQTARRISGHSDHDEGDMAPQPTTPLLNRRMSENLGISGRRRLDSCHSNHDPLVKMLEEDEPRSTWAKNTLSLLGICTAGIAGWVMAWKTGVWKPTPTILPGNPVEVAVGAQVVGYFSALCYLGARIPQIIKNYREKSCEGLSLLFFVFSLLGNATYGAGILFHSTEREYFLKSLPWLIGSLGTMAEDVLIFVQFRIYAVPEESSSSAIV